MSLISIIMPYYKKELFIEETINSILNQNYKDFEILIIDDEKSNSSFQILQKIKEKDNRIKMIVNDTNIGAGQSRNKGIDKARGDYIAFCDCDDLWKENKLKDQIKFMKDLNIDFSYTSYDIINEKSVIIGKRIADKEMYFEKLVKSCDIGLSSVIIKKNVFHKLKLNFPEISTKEDYILWLKMSKKGIKMFGLEQIYSSWRKSKNSLSSSTFTKILNGYKVYRVFLQYSFIKSLYSLFILSINFLIKK